MLRHIIIMRYMSLSRSFNYHSNGNTFSLGIHISLRMINVATLNDDSRIGTYYLHLKFGNGFMTIKF